MHPLIEEEQDEVEEDESGEVEEEEQEDGDEIVEEEELPEPEPLLGVDCEECFGCDFPEMECWQACYDCLNPYCENDDCTGKAMEEES